MHARNQDMRGVAVAAVIAVIGTVTLFFTDFDRHGEARPNGVGKTTMAAVERAGATLIPSRLATADERRMSVASD